MSSRITIVLNSLHHREIYAPYSLANLSLGAFVFHSELRKRVNLKLLSHVVGSTPESIAASVIEEKPDLCGFSSTTLTEYVLVEAITLIKSALPHTLIIVGGPSFVYTDEINAFVDSKADLFVNGEGEECLKQVIEAMCCNSIDDILEGRITIPGLFLKSKLGPNLEPHPILDLNCVVSPYASKNSSSFYDWIGGNKKHIYWETSRGCAFKCAYCAYSHRRPHFRAIPLDRLKSEVVYFNKIGVKAIFITDPVLGGPKSNTKRVLRLASFIESKPQLSVLLRAEYLDNEMIELLHQANVKWLDLGLQTTNSQLEYVNRRNNIPLLLNHYNLLRDAGIFFNLDLIIGFPGDNIESMLESLRFVIEEAKPNTIKIFPLRVYPGTAIHDIYLSSGSSWITFDQQTRLVHSTSTCSADELEGFVKFCNTTVATYRYLSSKDWFGKDYKYRCNNFFKWFYYKVSAWEFSNPDIWHIMNCPQNAYDEEKISRVWRIVMGIVDKHLAESKRIS